MADSPPTLDSLLDQVRSCWVCEKALPLGPRPVVQASSQARLLIIGQAPGTRVHETGLPFNDPSGDRLRHWLNMDRDTFYDPAKVALVPMGLCYPGRYQKGGDLPPRKECAPLWHPQIIPLLSTVKLTLLVGSYAQKYYLGKRMKPTLTETVFCWKEFGPRFFPLPHPSWRNTAWLKKNPWFEAECIPELQSILPHLISRT